MVCVLIDGLFNEEDELFRGGLWEGFRGFQARYDRAEYHVKYPEHFSIWFCLAACDCIWFLIIEYNGSTS